MNEFCVKSPSVPGLIGVLILLSAFLSGCNTEDNIRPSLIPMPQEINWTKEVFRMAGNETRIVKRLVGHLPEVAVHPEEGYTLRVTRDSVILSAMTPEAFFCGEQTLRQLTFVHKGRDMVAGCTITDWPAFVIRGFIQDVGRNYISLPLLTEQIDVLAAWSVHRRGQHLHYAAVVLEQASETGTPLSGFPAELY